MFEMMSIILNNLPDGCILQVDDVFDYLGQLCVPKDKEYIIEHAIKDNPLHEKGYVYFLLTAEFIKWFKPFMLKTNLLEQAPFYRIYNEHEKKQYLRVIDADTWEISIDLVKRSSALQQFISKHRSDVNVEILNYMPYSSIFFPEYFQSNALIENLASSQNRSKIMLWYCMRILNILCLIFSLVYLFLFEHEESTTFEAILSLYLIFGFAFGIFVERTIGEKKKVQMKPYSITIENEIAYWLKSLDETEHVPEIISALYIGIFEQEEGYCLYMIGAKEYDMHDDDWACEEDFTPRYKYHKIEDIATKSMGWETIQSKVVAAVKNYLNNHPDSLLFKNRKVAVGFDDGDLVIVK